MFRCPAVRRLDGFIRDIAGTVLGVVSVALGILGVGRPAIGSRTTG